MGFGGPGAWGAPYFNVQGYSPFGDNYLATPMHAWDTVIEGRDTLNWQVGRHSLKFGGAYQWFIWPMWGFFQNRGYYQFTNGFTTDIGATTERDRHWPVSCWGCRCAARTGRRSPDEPSPVVRGRVRAGYVAFDEEHNPSTMACDMSS